MFKKGDLVVVSAIVETIWLDHPDDEGLWPGGPWWKREGWVLIHIPPKKVKTWRTYEEEYRRKCLMRLVIPPVKGLVVGHTRRGTGYYQEREYQFDGDPPYMVQTKRHKVVMVKPIDKEQWVESWLCLEEDLILDKREGDEK